MFTAILARNARKENVMLSHSKQGSNLQKTRDWGKNSLQDNSKKNKRQDKIYSLGNLRNTNLC